MFSFVFFSDMDLNKTMVTASIPIVIRAGAYVKGVRAVVGLQLKYENFAKLFLESVSTCAIDAYPCPTRLTCKDDVSIFANQSLYCIEALTRVCMYLLIYKPKSRKVVKC